MKYLHLGFVIAAACGSKAPATGTGPDHDHDHGDHHEPLPAGLKWVDMNLDQRHQFMEETVLPETKKLFVAFDPLYEKMDCKTCHGPGAEDGTYEMPNPKNRPLPDSPESFMALLEKDARAAKYTPFMAQTLEPKMGELLQVKLFDPKTKEPGFSCSSCHYLVDGSGKVYPEPSRVQNKPAT